MIKLNLSKTLPWVVTLAATISVAAPALAGPILKGNASQTDSRDNAPATGLKRSDAGNMNDPFGGESSTPQADTPMEPGVFNLNTIENAAPPKNAFPLNASDDGGGDLQSQNAQPAAQPVRQAETETPKQPQRQFNPNDPDSSPEMQIAWDAWHQRVASNVFQRFSTLANAAFYRSRPLAAVAAYTVTRDGRILNARLTEANMNPMYNAIVLGAVNSMNGNLEILQFPPGSRRMMVDKVGTFIQNSGSGMAGQFKTIQGDRETIKQRR